MDVHMYIHTEQLITSAYVEAGCYVTAYYETSYCPGCCRTRALIPSEQGDHDAADEGREAAGVGGGRVSICPAGCSCHGDH